MLSHKARSTHTLVIQPAERVVISTRSRSRIILFFSEFLDLKKMYQHFYESA